MLITSELGGCALQQAAALVYLPSELVTSGGYNPQVRGEYFAVKLRPKDRAHMTYYTEAKQA